MRLGRSAPTPRLKDYTIILHGAHATAVGDIYHHSSANQTGFRCFSQFSLERGSGLVILTNGINGGDLWTRLVAGIGDL